MKNNNIVEIKNLIKEFPIGGDFFKALDSVDLEIVSLH